MTGPHHSPLDATRSAKSRDEREVQAEFDAHVAHRADELVAQGIARPEAEQQAKREFGDVERLRAESVEARRPLRKRASAWDLILQDLRFAARQLLRRPAFAATALLTLSLGIGATVTIVSLVRAVVLEPLPFVEPDRVVVAGMLTPERSRFSVSEGVFTDWEREVESFESIAGVVYRGGTLQSPGQPRSIAVGRVSHRLLDVLGMQPALGRTFRAEEDRPGQPAFVAMLSWNAWHNDFGADPTVIGSELEIDGDRFEVVGIMPEHLDQWTGDTPVFAPMGPDPTLDREDHYLDVIARLAPGTTIEVADTELKAVQDRISVIHNADIGWTTQLYPIRGEIIGETVERGGWVLLASAAVLLLMACANVSNLLMVRATTREAEMAVRMAIGASRGRLSRQLFVESGSLAIGGGLLGVLLAYTAVPVVQALGAARIPRVTEAAVDPPTLAAGLITVGLVTVVCGLAPVLQLRGRGTASPLRRGASDPGRRARTVLVSAQVGLTVVLLAGTGLLFRSFVALTSVDPGFEPEGTLAFSVNMPDESWDWRQRAVLLPEILDALEGLPGVTAVGATPVAPFSGGGLANFIASEDRMPDRQADFTPIHWRTVTPGFFESMGMAIRAGRDFRAEDGTGGERPVIIGRNLAEEMWGEADPIGRTLVWGDPDGSRLTVIGMVDDLRDVRLGEIPPMIVYRPYRELAWATMTAVVRYQGEDPSAIAAGIRPRVAEIAPGLPVGEIASLEQNVSRAVAEPRFNLVILGGFAVTGLLLALVGLYGLTAFDVRRRVPEIGIRLSLGADHGSIIQGIVRRRIWTMGPGLIAGIAIAWFASSRLEALLYGVEPNDPLTWSVVIALVVATSLVATYLPARSAMLVEPSRALQTEDG
ncbi:MAG: ABC transporter permease [Gemmatimonadota bacterium]